MGYKTANHIHTIESSKCSKISAKEIVKQYKKMGYNTIIITDHCYEKYFKYKGLKKWEDMVEYLCLGYEKAKEEAKFQDINVLFAIELTLKQTDSDYLIYGVTKEILLDTPYLYNYTLKQLKTWCSNNNFLLIQAHPYRDNSIKVAKKEEVDGFEIFNGSDTVQKNTKTYNYAKQLDAIMISGDDTHFKEAIGKTNIITRKEIKTINDFIFYISNQDYSLYKNKEEDRFVIEFTHNKKDFIDVWEIENQYLEKDTICSVEKVMKWDKKNKDIHIFIRDKLRDCIVGEITILPLNNEQFSKFIEGEFSDTDLNATELENYEENGQYNLLLSAIAIKKEYRNNPIILYLIFLGINKKIKKLQSRGITFNNICAEGQTIYGRNLLKSFLVEQNVTKEGYKLYTLPFENSQSAYNRVWKKFEKYIEKYYTYKIKELI